MSKPSFKKLGVGKRMPDDPLFKNGDTRCRMYIREGIIDIDDEQLSHKLVPVFPCEVIGCSETFSTVMEFEMHYNSRHRFICTQCRKPLPSAHFLDLHLSESHDSFFAAQAERKPMFRCLVEECSVVSQDVKQRRTHCIEVHSFPPDFRYDPSHSKSTKGNHKNESKLKSSESEKMIVDDVPKVRPDVRKQFTFGHVNKGKAFSVGSKSNATFSFGNKSKVPSFGNSSKAPFSFNKKSKGPFSFGKKTNAAFGNKSDTHQIDQEMSDQNKESPSEEIPEVESMDTNAISDA